MVRKPFFKQSSLQSRAESVHGALRGNQVIAGSNRAIQPGSSRDDERMKSVENLINIVNNNQGSNTKPLHDGSMKERLSKGYLKERKESADFNIEVMNNPLNPNQAKSESFEDFRSDSVSEDKNQDLESLNRQEGPIPTIAASERRGHKRENQNATMDNFVAAVDQNEGLENDSREESETDEKAQSSVIEAVKSVFKTFPQNKKNIEQYYLYKMTSMYSGNFRFAVIVAVVLTIVGEIMNYMTDSTSGSSLTSGYSIPLGRIFLLFIYAILTNRSFVEQHPTAIKATLMACILFDFLFDILQVVIASGDHENRSVK